MLITIPLVMSIDASMYQRERQSSREEALITTKRSKHHHQFGKLLVWSTKKKTPRQTVVREREREEKSAVINGLITCITVLLVTDLHQQKKYTHIHTREDLVENIEVLSMLFILISRDKENERKRQKKSRRRNDRFVRST